jgi:hypothetical protein
VAVILVEGDKVQCHLVSRFLDSSLSTKVTGGMPSAGTVVREGIGLNI